MKWCANIIFLGSNSLSHKGIWVALQEQEQHYSFLSVCAVFLCVQTTVWLPVFGTFNVCTEISACECTRGLYRCCKRVCTKRWLREKSLAAPGTQTCISVVPWFFSPTMYHLNYYHPMISEMVKLKIRSIQSHWHSKQNYIPGTLSCLFVKRICGAAVASK